MLENQPAITARSVKGRLQLNFERQIGSESTILKIKAQQPPLRVVRAFPLEYGGALVHLHNVSGGVLSGDQLELEAQVGPQAQAQLTGTSATRIYRSRGQHLIAQQSTVLEVAEGGLLEYLAEPLIPFAGSRYYQETVIRLAPDAGLFYWETVTPGRTARGEVFDYDLLEAKLSIQTDQRPIALEHYRLEPKLRPLTSNLRLGVYRYFSSFYICRVGLPDQVWRELETELAELAQALSRSGVTVWGVSTLPAHGLVVRALCQTGREIPAGLLAFWKIAKLKLYNQAAVLPRKIY